MNRIVFYNALRSSNMLFGQVLSSKQVEAMDALVDVSDQEGLEIRGLAYVFASIYHETGTLMFPIKETVKRTHKDKNPKDSVVIARLDRAWANGQLPWVKEPYWREGWFGRGGIQLTHKDNYGKMGRALGLNLIGQPEMALDPYISAQIAIIGCRDGMFTGRRLDQFFNDKTDNAPGARRIVNGREGRVGPDGFTTLDHKIAGYHNEFLRALREAGYEQRRPQIPSPSRDVPKGPLGRLLTAILEGLRGRRKA
jgi:predicted chitinase